LGSHRRDDVRRTSRWNHIEEINIVHNGNNYGWMKRWRHPPWTHLRGGPRRDEKADDGIPQTVAPVEEVQLFVRGVMATARM
jgi:hypothetical protein